MSLQALETLGHHEDAAGRFWIDAADEVLIIAVTDPTGKIIYANQRFCEISGYTQHELIGANHRILNSGTHSRAFFEDLFRTIHGGRTWRGEICNRAKNGETYWVATTIIPELDENTGKIRRFVACRFDITEQKLAEQRLREMAITDALTGLKNRRGFQLRFEEMLSQAIESSEDLAIMMIDIDHFKDVNDENGHDRGDFFLKTISDRLLRVLCENDLIARIGGDELAIVLPLRRRDATLDDSLQAVRTAIQTAVDLGVGTVSASASIGLAYFPKDGANAGDLIKCADVALYHAKRTGRSRVDRFDATMLDRSKHRITLEKQAFKGLENGEFELFYQPIVSLIGEPVASCEALIRWNNPLSGHLAPSHFFEIFECRRLAALIGEFVMSTVVDQAAAWRADGVACETIKFNTCSADFQAPRFADRLLAKLARAGLGADSVGVEVTEGMFLGQQSDAIRRELKALTEAGVEVSFDDFGTGYASLTHLKELPITRLKIDKSFITNILGDTRDRKIVQGLLSLAQSLGYSVTAEGVETKAQVDLLSKMGCDRIQGYFVSKPMNSRDIAHILRSSGVQRFLGKPWIYASEKQICAA